jgi:DNA-binding GntR family transcriptional regulator
MDTELPPRTRKTTCLEDLRRRILTLGIAPGTLLDEARLGAEYGISRTPLREVLQRLAGEGYVQLSDNRGAKVASMDLAALRTFFRTAPMIYAGVARLAADAPDRDQIASLRAVQRAFRAALDAEAPGEAALCNHRFHALIGRMADNPYLTPSFERLLIDHTRLSQAFYRPRSQDEARLVQTAAAQHDAMIDAIDAADPDRAVALTLEHWDLSRDRIDRFVRADPLPLDPELPAEVQNAL